MNDQLPKDLERRILQLLDGELDGNGLKQLDAELQGDKHARELYLHAAALHSALQNHHASRLGLPCVSIISTERLLAQQRRQQVRFSLMAAAALILISALVLWMIMVPPTADSLASFTITPDATFALTYTDGEQPPSGGNTLREGSRLQLSSGTMEVEFTIGVRCVIEAPCDLVVLSDKRISMAEGVAWFKVPPPAIGFTIETPQLTIVDLGTEFGILAPAAGQHEVHVITGKVEISTPGRQAKAGKLTLQAGQARRVDANGNFLKTALDSTRFMSALPTLAVIRNANFDSLEKIDKSPNNVGYGTIPNWATSGETVGVSNIDQPFLDQRAHSGTHAAFIQGKGAISQSLRGFDPSKLYTVTYFVSERGLPGAATRNSVSLDLGSSFYTQPDPIRKTDAFRRIVSGPLHVFGPTANIEIRAQSIQGDASLLIDSVSISRAVPAIRDGGFETAMLAARQFVQAHLPEASTLDASSWTFHQGAGIITNGSAFNAPPAPEGSQAAVLQNQGAAMETTIVGFEPGVTYRLHFEASGRHGGTAELQFILGGKPLRFHDSDALSPSIGRYQSFTSDEFQATDDNLPLRIHSTSEGATFFDDLHFEFVAEAAENH